MLELLGPKQQQQAEILGKAMRLGAMMWVDEEETRARLNWNAKEKLLTLILSPVSQSLFGEVAQGRLKSLACAIPARGECYIQA